MGHFHNEGIVVFRDDVAFEVLERVERRGQLAFLLRLHLDFYGEVVQLRQRPLFYRARSVLAEIQVRLRGYLLCDQAKAAALSIRFAVARDETAGIFVVVARIRGVDKRVPVHDAAQDSLGREECDLSAHALLHGSNQLFRFVVAGVLTFVVLLHLNARLVTVLLHCVAHCSFQRKLLSGHSFFRCAAELGLATASAIQPHRR